MTQSILNFTVAGTDERLTPKAGEAVFGEFLKAIGVDSLYHKHLPLPHSNHGFINPIHSFIVDAS